MASMEAVLAGLERMRFAGMKGAPDHFTPEQLAIWSESFAGVSDEAFAAGVQEIIRTEVFFPAIGTVYQISLKRAEQRADLAWLMVKNFVVGGKLVRTWVEPDTGNVRFTRTVDRSDIDDPCALWACSQMEHLETLAHREQPHRFEQDKRMEFLTLYRMAVQNGYKLESWNGQYQPLPASQLSALAGEHQKALTAN